MQEAFIESGQATLEIWSLKPYQHDVTAKLGLMNAPNELYRELF